MTFTLTALHLDFLPIIVADKLEDCVVLAKNDRARLGR